jgi:centromere protein C
MLDPKPTKHQGYQFQRIFTDGVFMAGGWLVIPPGCNKPLKPARDNTYVGAKPDVRTFWLIHPI